MDGKMSASPFEEIFFHSQAVKRRENARIKYLVKLGFSM